MTVHCIYIQGRIQDLAQGGDKTGAKRPKIFLSPPWAPQGGDRGGKGGDRIQDEGGKFCTILRFCTIYQMNLQENIEKKIFVPPLSHSGGGHFCCPPPELLRRGTILRGGTVPPLKLLRGGTVPYSPPCIRSCTVLYILILINIKGSNCMHNFHSFKIHILMA